MKFDIFNWQEPDPPGICSVATAIIGSAIIGGGAQMIGAQSAAGAQKEASKNATAAQLQMFEKAKEALQPFITAGQGGIPGLQGWLNYGSESSPLNALLKLVTPGASQTEALEKTPGYDFTKTQGLKSVNNALAARGLGGSGGAVAKGAANYVTGLAQNTWGSVVDKLLNTFVSGGNALQNLVNTGAGSAGALAGNSTQVGQQIGNNIIGAGNAQAGANIATGNAIAGMGGSLGTAAIFNKLMGGGGGEGGLYEVDPGSSLNPLPGLTAADYGWGY